MFGGQRVKKVKKVSSKGKNYFSKMNSVPIIQRMVQVMNNTTRTKAEARIRKEMARKVPILNLDFQPQKHPVKKDLAIPGNQTIGIPV